MSSYYTIPTNNAGYAWQPTAKTNNDILTQQNIMSNWKYRQYIQNNANQIMKYNSMSAIYASGNNPYTSESYFSSNTDSNVPVLYNSLYDNRNQENMSDLKQTYLQNEQMKARMIAPAINTNTFNK